MIHDSEILDKVGVKEIGLKSLLKSSMATVFGKGVTLADFHT